MRRRAKRRGKTHITAKKGNNRTLQHIDPTDPLHAEHHRRYADQYKKIRAKQRVPERNETLKFRSLGGGFKVDASGHELSSEEMFVLHKITQKTRGFYWELGMRKNGTERIRKRPTEPLKILAITFRPDYAIGLEYLDKHPTTAGLVKPFLKAALASLTKTFRAATGLEPISGQCHPEEGQLHFHTVYSTVSADNKLLWSKTGKGRKGLRFLGPSHIGTIRQADAGFIPEKDAGLARLDLADRMRSTGGEEPLDLLLSRELDAMCETFFSGQFSPVAEWAREKYQTELTARRSKSPAVLTRQIEELKSEIRHLRTPGASNPEDFFAPPAYHPPSATHAPSVSDKTPPL